MAGRPKRPKLACPECGKDTMSATLFARKGEGETWGGPDGWLWMHGDEHDCECGSKLVVEADGEVARLATRYVEDEP